MVARRVRLTAFALVDDRCEAANVVETEDISRGGVGLAQICGPTRSLLLRRHRRVHLSLVEKVVNLFLKLSQLSGSVCNICKHVCILVDA